MDRQLTFGKYKGRYTKDIILTHIGYIMWCLENVPWFGLNEEEQEIYDGIAIAIKKSKKETIYPTRLLYEHVKDKKALETLSTPFRIYGDDIVQIDKSSTLYKSLKKYQKKQVPSLTTDVLYQIAKHMDEFDDGMDYYDDDIECGKYCADDM